jgi:hypothetical protein
MDLETINKLYLELSQVATAETKNDAELVRQKLMNARRLALLRDIFNTHNIEEVLDSFNINRIRCEIDNA